MKRFVGALGIVGMVVTFPWLLLLLFGVAIQDEGSGAWVVAGVALCAFTGMVCFGCAASSSWDGQVPKACALFAAGVLFVAASFVLSASISL